jgi:hypothetical protein
MSQTNRQTKIEQLEKAQAQRLLARALKNKLSSRELTHLRRRFMDNGLNTREERAVLAGYMLFPDTKKDAFKRRTYILDEVNSPLSTK